MQAATYSEPGMTVPTGPTAPERPGKKQLRGALIQIGIGLVVVVIVFGFVLPSVIDYQQVWETIKSLSIADLLLLLVAGVILYIPEGWLYSICLPGMSFGRGVSSWVASTAAASTVPGVDVGIRYGMGRSYGGTGQQTMLWIPLTGIFDNVIKFSLPVLAIVVIVVAGEDVGDLEWVAVIAAAVLIIGAGVVIGIFRSHNFTVWLGHKIAGVVNWVLRLLKRDSISNIEESIVGFRDYTIETVRDRWFSALLASALGKLWALVILVIALRMVDIPADVLSVWQIFVVWAIVLLLTAIPITPGGIGIAEIGYIGLFKLITGEEWADVIGAGVVLFRLAQWALPIVIGWILIWYWRRQIRTGELPDPFAAESGA